MVESRDDGVDQVGKAEPLEEGSFSSRILFEALRLCNATTVKPEAKLQPTVPETRWPITKQPLPVEAGSPLLSTSEY